MFAIYAVAAVVGGVLVFLPALLGHHGSLAQGHAGIGHGHGHGHAHAGDHGGSGLESALWLTVFSIRFWSYAAAFFGLTGLLFDGLRLVPEEGATLGVSLAVGLGSGLLASWIISRLSGQVLSSVPTEAGYVGLAAEVLLEIQPDEPGRIRLSSRGALIDLPARSQRGDHFPSGARVVVVDTQAGVATVVAAPPA